jgi:hypothetical protein
MSSSKSFKHWLKGKKSADFTKIPLKSDFITKPIPSAPKTKLAEVPFYKKPIVDFVDFVEVVDFVDFRRDFKDPAHEVAMLLFEIAGRHPGQGLHGRNFVHSGGAIKAGCIIGALIMELPNGRSKAKQLINSGLANASLSSIQFALPRHWAHDSVTMRALSRAQAMNDNGARWDTIAHHFAREVGYHRPMKRAA